MAFNCVCCLFRVVRLRQGFHLCWFAHKTEKCESQLHRCISHNAVLQKYTHIWTSIRYFFYKTLEMCEDMSFGNSGPGWMDRGLDECSSRQALPHVRFFAVSFSSWYLLCLVSSAYLCVEDTAGGHTFSSAQKCCKNSKKKFYPHILRDS